MPRVNGGSPGRPMRASASSANDHGPYSPSMGMSLIVEKRVLRSGARPRAGSRRSASQAARRDATSDGFDVDRSVMEPTLAPGGADHGRRRSSRTSSRPVEGLDRG